MRHKPSDFDGCVIAESLRDHTLINRLRVWKAWISPHEASSDDSGSMRSWHIYWISCDAAEIDLIQRELKPWRWYAHFWRGNQMVVTYSDARFEMDRTDRSTWLPAIEHGKAKGIPAEQLDFLMLPHDP